MSMRARMESIYFWFQKRIVPELLYSQYFYEYALFDLVSTPIDWLDLGCGHQILPPWRKDQEVKLVSRCNSIVGIDYDVTGLRSHVRIKKKVRGDITRLPFKDATFDLVTSNMVIEHVESPHVLFAEVHRVLRKGGTFLFHTMNRAGYSTLLARMIPERVKLPLIYVLHGRGEEDVFRTYYRANDEHVIRELARNAGFQIDRVRMLNSSAILNVVPPLFIFELFWIRLLMTKRFRRLRTNIMVFLRKA